MEIIDFIGDEVFYDPAGQMIFGKNGEETHVIADIRGFGRMNAMFENPNEFQDDFGRWVAKAINEALIQERWRAKQKGMQPKTPFNFRGVYRPTRKQWDSFVFVVENKPPCTFSEVESINFETSKIHLKGGLRLDFSGLMEREYLNIVERC